jgi:hypothetical protein
MLWITYLIIFLDNSLDNFVDNLLDNSVDIFFNNFLENAMETFRKLSGYFLENVKEIIGKMFRIIIRKYQ